MGMRTLQAISLASKLRKVHLDAISRVPTSASDSINLLASSFGQYTARLPPSLRIELLYPHLQHFSHRQPLFEKLKTSGDMLLVILMNKHLGTRNLEVPEHLITKFCAARKIGLDADQGSDLLKQCIGAVSIFVGEEQCGEMVFQNILGGPDGLSNMYLNALYNGEL